MLEPWLIEQLEKIEELEREEEIAIPLHLPVNYPIFPDSSEEKEEEPQVIIIQM